MITRVARRLSLRVTILLLAFASASFAAEKLVLLAEQSTGGKLVAASSGVQAVILDKSCSANFAKTADARIEWKLPAALPAGWWRIVVESTLSRRNSAERVVSR